MGVSFGPQVGKQIAEMLGTLGQNVKSVLQPDGEYREKVYQMAVTDNKFLMTLVNASLENPELADQMNFGPKMRQLLKSTPPTPEAIALHGARAERQEAAADRLWADKMAAAFERGDAEEIARIRKENPALTKGRLERKESGRGTAAEEEVKDKETNLRGDVIDAQQTSIDSLKGVDLDAVNYVEQARKFNSQQPNQAQALLNHPTAGPAMLRGFEQETERKRLELQSGRATRDDFIRNWRLTNGAKMATLARVGAPEVWAEFLSNPMVRNRAENLLKTKPANVTPEEKELMDIALAHRRLGAEEAAQFRAATSSELGKLMEPILNGEVPDDVTRTYMLEAINEQLADHALATGSPAIRARFDRDSPGFSWGQPELYFTSPGGTRYKPEVVIQSIETGVPLVKKDATTGKVTDAPGIPAKPTMPVRGIELAAKHLLTLKSDGEITAYLNVLEGEDKTSGKVNVAAIRKRHAELKAGRNRPFEEIR